jgi:hypothetical protein
MEQVYPRDRSSQVAAARARYRPAAVILAVALLTFA